MGIIAYLITIVVTALFPWIGGWIVFQLDAFSAPILPWMQLLSYIMQPGTPFNDVEGLRILIFFAFGAVVAALWWLGIGMILEIVYDRFIKSASKT